MPPKSLTHLNDAPPEEFTIYAYCPCGHSAGLEVGNAEIRSLASRPRCSECGGREISISIVYTGAGEFHHGKTARRGCARTCCFGRQGISTHPRDGLWRWQSEYPMLRGLI